MKLAIGGLVVLVIAAVVAFALAVGATHDTVPDDLRDCIGDADAQIVIDPGTLGGLRADLLAGQPPRVQRSRIGDDDVALLTGTGYRALVLRAEDSAPVTGDVARAVYTRPEDFTLVATEVDPARGQLAGCIAAARAHRSHL